MSKKEFVMEKEVLPLDFVVCSFCLCIINVFCVGFIFSSFNSAYIVELILTFFSGAFFTLGLVILYMAFQKGKG